MIKNYQTEITIKSYRGMLRLAFYSTILLLAMLLSFYSKLDAQTPECRPELPNGTIPPSKTELTIIEGNTVTYLVRICPPNLNIPDEGILTTLEVTPSAEVSVTPPAGLLFYSDTRVLTVSVHAISDQITEIDTIVVVRHISGTENINLTQSFVTITVKDNALLYLPSVHKDAKWEQIRAAGEEVDVLAVHSQELYAGHRVKTGSNVGGGVYTTTCQSAGNVISLVPNTAKLDVRDLYSEGSRTLIGTFGAGVYFSKNGTSFEKATGLTNPYVYAVLFSDATTSYAGADNGLYRGDGAGTSWNRVFASTTDLNTIRVLRLDPTDTKNLWIGTPNGLWQVPLPNGTPVKDNLEPSSEAQNVRDILFDNSTIYLATADGVYQRQSNTAWKQIGKNLNGRSILSLEKHNGNLYAGSNDRDVYLYNEAITDWVPTGLSASGVRDLLSDSALCNGLVAATADGIWVLR